MQPIAKVLESTSREELLREHDERGKMISEQLVGWLYPSILRNEMLRIRQRAAELGKYL